MSKILDSKTVKSLGDIFSSKARVEVLQALIQLDKPVGLRKLARICEVHPRSVELALNGMLEEKRIRKHPLSRGANYTLNWKHPDAERMRCIFNADSQARLQSRNPQILRDGKALCSFIDDGLALLQRGRSSINAVK